MQEQSIFKLPCLKDDFMSRNFIAPYIKCNVWVDCFIKHAATEREKNIFKKLCWKTYNENSSKLIKKRKSMLS